eukprot:PhM_4_TR10526/c0_g1_i1/m.74115
MNNNSNNNSSSRYRHQHITQQRCSLCVGTVSVMFSYLALLMSPSLVVATTTTASYSWTSIIPLPAPCSQGSAFSIGSYLVHLGGCCSDIGHTTPTDCPSNVVLYFDVAQPQRWYAFPPLASGIVGSTTTTVIGNTMFVFGQASEQPLGARGENNSLVQSLVVRDSRAIGSWSVCQSNVNRTLASVVSLSGRIFLLGGVDPTTTTLQQDVLEYSHNDCTFRTVLQFPDSAARARAAVCPTSTGVYYIGGADKYGRWTSDVWLMTLDETTGKPSLSAVSNMPSALPYPSCGQVERTLWIMSNQTSNENVVMYSFDLELEQWHRSDDFVGMTPLCDLGGFAAISNQLYLLGGMTTGSTMTNQAQRVNVMTLPQMTLPNGPYYTNESFVVSFNDFHPRPAYRVLLSSSSDCSTALSGADIAEISTDNYTATFQPKNASVTNYLCYTEGWCSQEKRSSCVSTSNVTTAAACNLAGCCFDDTPGIPMPCFEPTARKDANNIEGYHWALLSPVLNFSILPSDAPDPTSGPTTSPQPTTPPPSGPNSDDNSPSKFSAFIAKYSMWLAVGFAALVVLVCLFIIVWVRTRRYLRYALIGSDEDGPSGNGEYRLLKKLGSGGYGTVFLVSRRSDDALFALKYITCATDEQRQDAMKEFEMLKRLQGHENMIRLIDMILNWRESVVDGTTPRNQEQQPRHLNVTSDGNSNNNNNNNNSLDGEPTSTSGRNVQWSDSDAKLLSAQSARRYCCLVMEYYPEGDLKAYILRAKEPLSQSFVINITTQICRFLEHIHTCTPPIIHRDMKPENVLLSDHASRAVVTDFGLARAQIDAYMQTQAGSLPFVAPECWQRRYSTMADMWGLGCIMYAMCTRRAGQHNTRVMFSDASKVGFEAEVRQEMCRYSVGLTEVVLSLLAMEPKARPSAKEVLAALSTLRSSSGGADITSSSSPLLSPATTERMTCLTLYE